MEQKLKHFIGDLIVQNISLAAQVEELQKKLKELEEKNG